MLRSGIAFFIVIAFGFGAFAAPRYDCPKNPDSNKHGNLGAKYWENGQFRLAEQEAREAIKLSPDCSMWHQNLGFILESMERYEDASQSWHKSLEVDKNWCTAYKTGSLMKLGLYYYERRRDFKNSIDFFEKALATGRKEEVDSKTLSSIYLYLSYNYTEPKERGNSYYNLRTAEELKKKALDLNPDNLFVKASVTKLLVLQNKLNEANRNISEIISAQEKSQNPNPGVYSYLAHIYSLLKDPIRSAFYIEKAIDLDQGQAQYLLNELDKDFRDVSSSKEMKRIIAKAKELRKR